MSIFDEVLGKVSTLFSDSEQAKGVFKLVIDLTNKPAIGGISGLVKLFQEKGLEGVISSWISTGQNLPISSEQVQQVLGGDEIQKIATNTGLPVENIAADLSKLLPLVIDKLTPNGEVSDSNSLLAQGLDFLKGKLAASDTDAIA
jgi:uncharacterized protein YidB (DUF937 family)